VRETDLTEILISIRTGNFRGLDFIDITGRIRSLNDHGKQNELKYWNLPAALFNGVFSYKNNESLQQYSCYTAMDFDGFSTEQELQHIGYWLTQTPWVYAIFRTPSGKGLKAIVLHNNTDPLYHGELYEQLMDYFKIPQTDNSVKDLAMGNYLCYDPDLWINPVCKAYHFEHAPSYVSPKTQVKRNTAGTAQDLKMLEFMLNLKQPVGSKSDESIIAILNAHWKKNPGRWKQGNRANSVFQAASELCNAGVRMQKALDYLIREYTAVNLDIGEITYQATRGYQWNAETYGINRQRFDNYGH
jgi:hypothetical protein